MSIDITKSIIVHHLTEKVTRHVKLLNKEAYDGKHFKSN